MTNPSPDLRQPQVEAESVDTTEFLGRAIAASVEAMNIGPGKEWASFIAHIDSIITARVAAARQEGRRDTHEEKIQLMLANAKLEDALAASQAAPAKAEGWWKDLLAAVVRETPKRHLTPGNAPGHCHSVPGIWDSDNGARAGLQCAWCLVWNEAQASLAAPSTPLGEQQP